MIRFQTVTKTFRRARILDNIDLQVGLGERVALIGSNGAGKTTLIRCLLGEYVHDGTVLIDGRNPRHQRTEVLGMIGFVPQLPPPPQDASGPTACIFCCSKYDVSYSRS